MNAHKACTMTALGESRPTRRKAMLPDKLRPFSLLIFQYIYHRRKAVGHIPVAQIGLTGPPRHASA
ncbi:hypothetical protein CSQ93_04260 [Janthinobacterium sp. BJB426]|nr:hypothetical protein CSQ93_04260 [Janthinobacterium sp. BJB426]